MDLLNDPILGAAARKNRELDIARDAELKMLRDLVGTHLGHVPVPPVEDSPTVGSLGTTEVRELLGLSRSTMQRYLAIVPAPRQMGGDQRTVSRWPDREAAEDWLAAVRAKRKGLDAPPPQRKPRSPSKPKLALVDEGEWESRAAALGPLKRRPSQKK